MKDLNVYQLRLEKSLEQKMFFVNKVDLRTYDLIVDFGCGTGALLRRLSKEVPEYTKLIGYDINSDMLVACEKQNGAKNIVFTDNFDLIKECTQTAKRTMIIFSTVLHEIDGEKQLEIAESIMPLFDTVVIRDMKRPLNNEPISNLTRKRVLMQVAPWQAQMFESRWGKIRDKENLYRFFLMNEFVENFETEVEEDYFGVKWSEITWKLQALGYKSIYEYSYTLPYRKAQVKKLFNHVMHDITHRELIMTKKGK